MKNADKPAFALAAGDQSNLDDRLICEGLTKREYFAGIAMQGLLATYKESYDIPTRKDLIANFSISMADELLKQLDKK